MAEILDTYDKTKAWLERYVNRNIFPKDPEFQVLSELLNRHPSKSTWKNQVPTSFKISRSTGNGSLVLYVRFEGLTKYRIVSWVACSKGKLASKPTGNELNSAMRYAVRVQISNYRKSHPVQICELCTSDQRI